MSNFHDFTLEKLGGGELPLDAFKGKVTLVVNVASKCGLTPQYEKLEPLFQEFKERGFSILGIPCNQFMGQEPGSDEEIQSFCQSKYGVSFPMSGKLDVNGDNRHALYDYLAGDEASFPGDIQWNFEKFLIGKNGEVIQRFAPKAEPDDENLLTVLKAAL